MQTSLAVREAQTSGDVVANLLRIRFKSLKNETSRTQEAVHASRMAYAINVHPFGRKALLSKVQLWLKCTGPLENSPIGAGTTEQIALCGLSTRLRSFSRLTCPEMTTFLEVDA